MNQPHLNKTLAKPDPSRALVPGHRQKLRQVQRPWNFLRFVYGNFMRNDGMENAKSLTYTSLFAVVPLLTLVFSLLSAFPTFQAFGSQVQNMIYERLLPDSGDDLQAYLTDFAGQARNLTWAGAVMLFVTAYLMLVNIERNFNKIWGVSEQRKGITSFLLYWSVLSLGPLLLGLGFAISSYLTSLQLFQTFTEVSDIVGARNIVLGIFPLLLTTAAFTLLYVAVPNCGVQLRHGLYGALTVALAFIVVKWIFTQFISMTSFELVYGAFAAIPIFLMWIYICWVVILFGANLVHSIPLYGSNMAGVEVHPALLLLALLHRFWEKQQTGAVLQIKELLEEEWPFRSAPVDQLLSELEKQHLIQNVGEDEYVLSRDLEALGTWDVLSRTPWGLPPPDTFDEPLPPVIANQLPGLEVLKARFGAVHDRAAEEFGASLGHWFRRQS